MLNYVITFFILAMIAAIFGFGGLAQDFAEIARFLALVFIVLFVFSLIGHAGYRRNNNSLL